MKTLVLILLVAAALGGCVVAPVGPDYGYAYDYRYGYGYPYAYGGYYPYYYGYGPYYRHRYYWRQAP
jgi:hypothetical protein